MRASDILITVIVPMYNAEEFLEYTLESLSSQTIFRDVEILLVDDCSTDDTLSIANRYAQRYQQFILLRQDHNKGVSAARNLGLDQAKGQYVFFIDADDTIPERTLEIMYQAAQDKQADVITGIYKRFDSKSESVMSIFHQFPELANEGYISICEQPQLFYSVYSWGKLYKRELLAQIRYFEDISYCEDHVFTLNALLVAERIYNLPSVVYNYRTREESLSQSIYKDPAKNMRYLIKVVERLKGIFDTEIPNPVNKNEMFSVYLSRVLHWNIWTVVSHGLLSTRLTVRHNIIGLYLDWLNTVDESLKVTNARDFEIVRYRILQISTVLDSKSAELCHRLLK
ncbi:putative glycosyltransferase EpsJ [compost metagenome]